MRRLPRRAAPVATAVLLVAGCGAPSAGDVGDDAVAPSPTIDCTPTGVTSNPNQTYADVDGVAPAYLRIQVEAPTLPAGCPPPPVVLYVHGGNFDGGSFNATVKNAAQTAVFTSRGWAFAAMNYQLVGLPAAGAPTSSYPVQPGNVAAAVSWLAANGEALGVDGTRVAVVGPTAGGFLAAQVGSDDRFLTEAQADPGSVRCVVTVSVEGYDLSTLAQGDNPSADMWRRAFPDPATWRQASPITHVLTTPTPRQWLLVTSQNRRYLANAQDFARQIRSGSGLVEVLPVDAAVVPKPADVVGQPGESVVTPAVVSTLEQCLNRR